MTTLAGECGNPGNVDGDLNSALFSNGIEDIACLANCTFLVTDPSSRSVRAIAPDQTCAPHHEPPAAGELLQQPVSPKCSSTSTFVLAPCDRQEKCSACKLAVLYSPGGCCCRFQAWDGTRRSCCLWCGCCSQCMRGDLAPEPCRRELGEKAGGRKAGSSVQRSGKAILLVINISWTAAGDGCLKPYPPPKCQCVSHSTYNLLWSPDALHACERLA